MRLTFLLTVFLISTVTVFAQVQFTEIFASPASLPDCPPGAPNALLWRFPPAGAPIQSDVNGNHIEIWCEGGQYRLKIINQNGTVLYVGKCIYNFGRNTAKIKLDVWFNQTAAGKVILNFTVNRTEWTSHNASAPGNFNGTPAQNVDIHWVYDQKTGMITAQNTSHYGNWINSSTYNVTNSTPVGPPKTYPVPTNPANLTLASRSVEAPSCAYASASTSEVASVVPVTITENPLVVGVMHTAADGTAFTYDPVEATEGMLFTYDVNQIGEDIELTSYSLVEAPNGMTINKNTGIISWTPAAGQAGEHKVSVKTSYPEFEPAIDSFVLPVKAVASPTEEPTPAEKPTPQWYQAKGIITLVIACLLIILFIVFRMFNKKEIT